MNKVLAIDFDDTLCATLPACYKGINNLCGSNMKFEEHDSPIPCHNPEIGTPCGALRKYKRAFRDGLIEAFPLDGVQAVLMDLHKRGYQLHIITARTEENGRPYVEGWLDKHGITFGEDGIITSIHFVINEEDKNPTIPSEVGSTESAIAREKELNQTLLRKWKKETIENPFGKAKVKTARDLGASVLIDDRIQFLRPIQETDTETGLRGILFGNYKWCYNNIDFQHPTHLLTYDERIAAGLEFPFSPVNLGKGVEGARNWEEVLELIKKWENEENDA